MTPFLNSFQISKGFSLNKLQQMSKFFPQNFIAYPKYRDIVVIEQIATCQNFFHKFFYLAPYTVDIVDFIRSKTILCLFFVPIWKESLSFVFLHEELAALIRRVLYHSHLANLSPITSKLDLSSRLFDSLFTSQFIFYYFVFTLWKFVYGLPINIKFYNFD